MATTNLGEKLTEAINAKNNDVNTFVWKFARDKQTGTQSEIKLMDATPEQLNEFYDHCSSMLYNTNKVNPGRYTLLDIIKDQRYKCNIELFLRKLESGAICPDNKPYPRYLYLQDIREYMNNNKNFFPTSELKNISIASIPGIEFTREFERISIADVVDGCLDSLGYFDNKHITTNFILSMGVYLTPAEMREFDEKDENGKTRSRLSVVKERLKIKDSVRLNVKPTGLSFAELRSMIKLRPKKYSDLTTDQLTALRNKILFKLENEVKFHISQWEERMRQIELVADERGITIR